jgi:hypothetical protein
LTEPVPSSPVPSSPVPSSTGPRPLPGPRPGDAAAAPVPLSPEPDPFADLDERPVAEHVVVYETEHARLQRELGTIDQL